MFLHYYMRDWKKKSLELNTYDVNSIVSHKKFTLVVLKLAQEQTGGIYSVYCFKNKYHLYIIKTLY